MKNINTYIIGLLLAILTIGCSDELEKTPYNQLSTGLAFNDINDASYWVNGMYSRLRGDIYGSFTFATDIQADELNATLGYGNRYGELHKWKTLTPDDSEISYIWENNYKAIANINVALDGFNKISTTTDEEKQNLERYRGELLIARAYYNLELVRKFCKAYSPDNASSTLGIPVLLEYDIKALPKRSSLEESYNQILSDIENAKKGLANVAGTPMANRFNIDFVYALEARAKLYKQDWKGAKEAANRIINSGVYTLANGTQELKSMWVNDNSKEIIYQSFVQTPDELASTNDIYLGYNPDSKKYTPSFLPSKWVINLYDDNDARKEVYFLTSTVLFEGQDYQATMINKYPGNPELFTAASTNYQQAPKIFRLAEMYLISSEASFKLGDLGGALEKLNALKVARGIPVLKSTTLDLYKEIKDERTRELAFEGFRLDDLKRWGERVKRSEPQSLDYIVPTPSDQFYLLDRASTDYKIVWPIPARDVQVNPNMVQNPEW